MVPLLARDHRVIRYDVRGFGSSAAPDQPYSDADDLRDLLDDLGVEQAHLIGLSLGGRIAIDCAIQHPERVQSLVLAGPGLSGFRDDADGDERMWQIIQAVRDGDTTRGVELWLRDPYMQPAMEHAELAPRLRQLSADNARSWLTNPVLERPLEPRANVRLGEVHAPTLILVGSRDVPTIQAIVKQLEQGLAGARKAVIEGAGHMVNMEKRDEFNQLVQSFLQSNAKQPEVKPDLSGAWHCNLSKSTLQIKAPDRTVLTLDHHEPILHINRRHVSGDQIDEFGLEIATDGKLALTTRGNDELRTRAHWDGATLVFLTVIHRATGDASNVVRYQLARTRDSLRVDEQYRSKELSYDNVWVFERE